jgi:formylglycine-generating enzyme required for sulfatase activity
VTAHDCPVGMVSVPAGTFWMGSLAGMGQRNEQPTHQVTLSGYCIDRTEVTVKAYESCVAAKDCSVALPTIDSTRGYSPDGVKQWSRYCNQSDRPDHPINCVDWEQASAYCRWVGKRLPTEAEWEYAARGSDGRRYPWGNVPPAANLLNACGSECVAIWTPDLGEKWEAMYEASDGWATTAPVGTFPAGASPFGVLDMAGNVWEWTADWYGDYSDAPVRNPKGAVTGLYRVTRGGGWLTSDVRAAFRMGDLPGHRRARLGFRCAGGS